MTKAELIDQISKRNVHMNQKEAEVVVNQIFDSMMDALVKGERIEIRGFGSFSVKSRPQREGRNPKTGEPVTIPAKRVPFFKVGKELHEKINGIRS